jgi:very-short-patch-repair endonuclease
MVKKMKYTEIRDFSRALRKDQTPYEKLLWKRLRHRQVKGFKFLRQHPISYDRKANDYNFIIPDFYCAEAHLLIELEGGIHDNTIEYDSWRQNILENMGIRVLRIKNEELADMEEVIARIKALLHTLPQPLPTSREGQGWVR